MKTLLLFLISITCNAQVYFRTDSVPAKLIKQDVVTYDTLLPTIAYVPRYLAIQGIGIKDTTKYAIIEYRVRIIEKLPVLISKVDNNSGQTFTGTWQHPTLSGHYNNTISWSCTAGSTTTHKFNGRGIRWIGEKLSTHGNAEISIDGVVVATVNCYNETILRQQVLYENLRLSPGDHTIVIKCIDKCIVSDAFEIFN